MTNSSGATNGMVWRQVFWPRPLSEDVAVRVMNAWATDQRSPIVVLEAQSIAGAVRYRLGSPRSDVGVVKAVLTSLCPGVLLTPVKEPRLRADLAARLKVSTRHRPLRTDDLAATSRTVLAALSRTRTGESLSVQAVLGPRRIPLAVPNSSPSSTVEPWWQIAWYGNGGQLDGEKRSALRLKVSEHGFAATVRLGVHAATKRRQELLIFGLMAALRGAEAPGVQLRLHQESGERIAAGSQPWRWPLRLGVHEALALTGWPISSASDEDLPGLPAPHPRPLPPVPGTAKGRLVAAASAPGADQELRLSVRDQLQHLHVIGPTGVGKSTLLASLALQDIQAGSGVVVIDPKGDLVDDILARLPAERMSDVVVLDPSDQAAPVGFNPLAPVAGRQPDVLVDGLLAVFHQLWADSWGPRTQDILHACLLTLTRRKDASLVMLPLLLTNPGFRRSISQQAVREDPVALGPFWAWYEQLSAAERAAVIAPVMNKLRAFLLRPSMRAVLGQVQPAFAVRQVFTERKVLLVSLSKGLVGAEAAALLGSLIVAELWQCTLERAAVAASKRSPVHVVIDELQDYLHLPTDLSDALAQARGMGVGFTLAHQFLDQLPRAMQAAVLANARSRVCFQLPPTDAAVLARGHSELSADDFGALGRYQVYASLLRGGRASPYVSGQTLPLGKPTGSVSARRAISRHSYGRSPSEVESGFAELANQAAAGDAPLGRRRAGDQP